MPSSKSASRSSPAARRAPAGAKPTRARANVAPTGVKSAPARAGEPAASRRAFEEICQRIRDQLAVGQLKPGDKLPAERELAGQLGVGRNALREALRSLEIAGIVRLAKGVKGGAFIREGDTGLMNQVVQDMLWLGSITLDELTEARLTIQDDVVRMACERATPEDLAALDANIARTEAMTAEGRYLERVECSREFYRLLGEATHNQVMAMMMNSLSEILMKFVYARVAEGGPPQPRLVEKRRAFVAALRARDVESAREQMRRHLESVHRLLEAPAGAATKSRTRKTVSPR